VLSTLSITSSTLVSCYQFFGDFWIYDFDFFFFYIIFIEKNGAPVSPFHDIPLFANAEKTILNMVVEIPRWSNAKLEVKLVF
jgi:hypothetical protein